MNWFSEPEKIKEQASAPGKGAMPIPVADDVEPMEVDPPQEKKEEPLVDPAPAQLM